jgi:signal transduction histidine kinase
VTAGSGAIRLTDVRKQSLRVALAATGIVAIAYLIVAIAVVGLVTRDLTAQVDARLTSLIAHPLRDPRPGGGTFEPGSPDARFAPILAWGIFPDGTVVTNNAADGIDLPADYQNVSDPVTATVGGVPVRLMGVQLVDGYIVVGQSIAAVTNSQGTLILSELAIAPVLLLIVFLGAVAIGRRVASPVERARRQQLEFTADASHELRTPLSVIEANTSLALAQPRDEDWYRTAFERVDNESKRMRKLLEDMLWLARFDTEHGPPNAEPVDVGVLASATADRFGAVAEARKLTLVVNATAADSVISVPPDWLDRLLGVLLDNACKFSAEGGTVKVSVTSDSGRVSLTVDDAGPGVPDEERPRIFDRFHRASETKSGAGLGLAIADAIVRATDGRWKVGTSAAGGASMSVSWPRAFAGPKETAPRRAPQATDKPAEQPH